MRPSPILALPLAVMLSGCETTPQAGDATPPTVTVRENASGLPVMFTTDPEETPAPAVCPAGTRPIGGGERSVDNLHYILHPRRSRADMTFFFSDPSGIRSASVEFAASSATVHEPDLPVETRPAHGGATGRFHVWEFAETGTLKDLQGLALEITPARSQPGTPIVVQATDGAGNAMPARLFFVAPAEAYCG